MLLLYLTCVPFNQPNLLLQDSSCSAVLVLIVGVSALVDESKNNDIEKAQWLAAMLTHKINYEEPLWCITYSMSRIVLT